MGSFRAELTVLRKRAAVWVLLAVAALLSVFFAYVLPYASYLSTPAGPRDPRDLAALLPAQLVSNMLGGFPFYFGVLALILGVLAFGSEYGWGTLKTTLMQRPGRLRLLGAKVAALGVALVPFVAVAYLIGAIATSIIAVREGQAAHWPAALDVVGSLAASWLILALWAMFGALLATLSRGTSLAIGLGILYGLVIEGLISAFGNRIALLGDVSRVFLRTNGYSLVAPLRDIIVEADGPGRFNGPFVGAWQALLVIVAYLAIFTGVIALLLRRRDIA